MARRGKTGLVGAGQVRKVLKALPDEARKSIIDIYRVEGPAIAGFMRSRTPVRSGAGRSAITHRIAEKSLVLRVGVIGKALNGVGRTLGGKKTRSVFYLKILERGRGLGRSTTRAFTRKTPSGGRSKTIRAKISPISRGRYDFVEGVVSRAVIARLRPKLAEVWKRAIAGLGSNVQ